MRTKIILSAALGIQFDLRATHGTQRFLCVMPGTQRYCAGAGGSP